MTHTPYEYIKYIKIADYLWQDITIDFIMKLLKSEEIITRVKYDSILVIMDKLTKYTHLILYNKRFTVKQTACVVLDKVIRYHRILKNITLDRDKIFKSNFWKTLISEIGTRIKLSTVYYS